MRDTVGLLARPFCHFRALRRRMHRSPVLRHTLILALLFREKPVDHLIARNRLAHDPSGTAQVKPTILERLARLGLTFV